MVVESKASKGAEKGSKYRKEQQSRYVAIRWEKIHPGVMDEAVRRAQEGRVPILRNGSGFVAYSLLNLGNDDALVIDGSLSFRVSYRFAVN